MDIYSLQLWYVQINPSTIAWADLYPPPKHNSIIIIEHIFTNPPPHHYK